MIFQIATFRIKIQSSRSSGFAFPTSFLEKFSKYLIDKSRRIDFLITVVPYDEKIPASCEFVRRQGHWYHEGKGTITIKSRTAVARVNAGTTEMTLGFKYRQSLVKNNATLLAFVRLALSLLTIRKGGLPIHSSALSLGKCGIAFSGPSGAGKSTIAKMLDSPWQLLNDDFNIVLPEAKNAYGIYSTPFTQPKTLSRCVNRKVNLRVIFFIEQSSRNAVENLLFKKNYVLLLGQTHIFPLTEYFGKKILDNAERICRIVECKRLHFSYDGTFRPFIEHFVKGLV